MSHELVIGDERFACQDELSAWALMKLAKASQGSDMAAVAGMYDLMLSAVLPAEHERFEAYMDAHVFSFDVINTAIGALMTSYTDRPTQRPSLSPAGPIPSAGTSRVVSLSRGTVREVETSLKDGVQAVS